jgi:hypothetical protein
MNSRSQTLRLACAAGLASLLATSPAFAHGPAPLQPAQATPAALQVHGPLPARADTVDLKFGDFFKRPVGPRGLEATPLLMSLDGQRVRIVGYMVRQDSTSPVAGLLVLSPLPVAMGEEDESFADDLPASAVYVHLADAQHTLRLPHMPGLMVLTGTLQLGALAEPDGRRSMVRLLLDDAVSREFEAPAPAVHPAFSAFMERLDDSTR